MAGRSCSRCKMLDDFGVDGQVFHDYDTNAYYDIGLARQLLRKKPRQPIVIPSGQAYESVQDASLVKKHVPHVNCKFPAIAVKHKGKYLIIDGNHRVFQRLCKLLPVKVYLLTASEKRAILS